MIIFDFQYKSSKFQAYRIFYYNKHTNRIALMPEKEYGMYIRQR